MPKVTTSLCRRDHLGTIGARTGFTRNNYKITPGLYCIGSPDVDSSVVVSGNYKLSFDSVRQALHQSDAWLLVVDTRGINVWCAAGKGTFSAEEIGYQVEKSGLARLVSHRRLILPQLAASGVAAHKLPGLCGFRGEFGPISATMLKAYLKTGTADEKMRTITFNLAERATLVPLEVLMLWKIFLFLVPGFFLLSGIGPELFSWQTALRGTVTLLLATLTGVLGGAILTPLFLPLLPPRQFWFKGLLTGVPLALIFGLLHHSSDSASALTATILWILTVSSYMAMNFTGCTPYTSLSGVAKEMRSGLALQITGTALALICWVAAPFL